MRGRWKTGALIVTCALGGGVGADVVNLPAAKDNTLFESSTGALSNGAGEYTFTGRIFQLAGESLRRSLLAFDIAGSIPAG